MDLSKSSQGNFVVPDVRFLVAHGRDDSQRVAQIEPVLDLSVLVSLDKVCVNLKISVSEKNARAEF